MRSKSAETRRFTKLELQILEALWANGKASIREIHEAFPEPRPAYTTVQTTVNRLEIKQALRRVRKIGNAHIYEPLVAREAARHRFLDDILSLFGGRGEVRGALLGSLVIVTVSNGLNTAGYKAGVIYVITGVILLLAVTLDTIARRLQVRSGR